jgi:hypothetical protein
MREMKNRQESRSFSIFTLSKGANWRVGEMVGGAGAGGRRTQKLALRLGRWFRHWQKLLLPFFFLFVSLLFFWGGAVSSHLSLITDRALKFAKPYASPRRSVRKTCTRHREHGYTYGEDILTCFFFKSKRAFTFVVSKASLVLSCTSPLRTHRSLRRSTFFDMNDLHNNIKNQ